MNTGYTSSTLTISTLQRQITLLQSFLVNELNHAEELEKQVKELQTQLQESTIPQTVQRAVSTNGRVQNKKTTSSSNSQVLIYNRVESASQKISGPNILKDCEKPSSSKIKSSKENSGIVRNEPEVGSLSLKSFVKGPDQKILLLSRSLNGSQDQHSTKADQPTSNFQPSYVTEKPAKDPLIEDSVPVDANRDSLWLHFQKFYRSSGSTSFSTVCNHCGHHSSYRSLKILSEHLAKCPVLNIKKEGEGKTYQVKEIKQEKMVEHKRKRRKSQVIDPETARIYLGKYVQRLFEEGFFFGLVAKAHNEYFLVVYEDGDAEDLLVDQVETCLYDTGRIPPERRKACIEEAKKMLSVNDEIGSTLSLSSDPQPYKRQKVGEQEVAVPTALTEENLKKLPDFEMIRRFDEKSTSPLSHKGTKRESIISPQSIKSPKSPSMRPSVVPQDQDQNGNDLKSIVPSGTKKEEKQNAPMEFPLSNEEDEIIDIPDDDDDDYDADIYSDIEVVEVEKREKSSALYIDLSQD